MLRLVQLLILSKECPMLLLSLKLRSTAPT